MTTHHQMAMMYATQQQVIAALTEVGDLGLAERLADCMTTRLMRHSGSGWPRICRSAACEWCRRPMMRGWWAGMCQWTAEATTWSLAIIPLLVGWPDRRRSPAAAWPARCPGQDGTAQSAMACYVCGHGRWRRHPVGADLARGRGSTGSAECAAPKMA
jgi:hypothetical protein